MDFWKCFTIIIRTPVTWHLVTVTQLWWKVEYRCSPIYIPFPPRIKAPPIALKNGTPQPAPLSLPPLINNTDISLSPLINASDKFGTLHLNAWWEKYRSIRPNDFLEKNERLWWIICLPVTWKQLYLFFNEWRWIFFRNILQCCLQTSNLYPMELFYWR